MRKIRWVEVVLVVFLIFVFAGIGFGEEKENKNPVRDFIITDIKKMENGINYIDLDGDGYKDIIVSGHRHNVTAHAFQVYTIYIYSPLKFEGKTFKWQIVAIDDKEKGETYMITTNEGADCVLRDIRLAKLKDDNKYYLIIAERLPTKTYIDREFVIFKFYKLYRDELENRYIYKKVFEKRSNKKYCDVNEAFSELKRE